MARDLVLYRFSGGLLAAMGTLLLVASYVGELEERDPTAELLWVLAVAVISTGLPIAYAGIQDDPDQPPFVRPAKVAALSGLCIVLGAAAGVLLG